MGLSIILLAEDFVPNIGGIAAHVHQLAVHLAKAGHTVEVISTMKQLPKRNLWRWRSRRSQMQGVDVLEIPMVYSPRNLLFSYQVKYRFSSLVKKEIRDRKAQVIHWHNIHFDPEVIKQLLDVKVTRIFTNHSSQFLIDLSSQRELEYNRTNLSYAHAVIAPSSELKEATIRCGFPGEQTFFIPNGVDTNRFAPTAERRLLTRKRYNLHDEIAIICPRRVVPKCGVIYLAKALRHLRTKKKVKIFFTGLSGGTLTWRDRDYENAVRAELSDHPATVEIVSLHHVPNEEMPSLYNGMDICVLPSLIEATSISGLEAMSSGLALIGTQVGGIPEIIEDQISGWLVEKANEEQLANALDTLIDEDERRHSLGKSARHRASTLFDWTIIAEKTAGIYARTMK